MYIEIQHPPEGKYHYCRGHEAWIKREWEAALYISSSHSVCRSDSSARSYTNVLISFSFFLLLSIQWW